MVTELTDLSFIGSKTKKRLSEQGYETIEDVVDESVLELLEIKGIGKKTLRAMKRDLEVYDKYTNVFQDSVFLKKSVSRDDVSLECETDIVWLKDLDQFEFVREKFKQAGTREQRHSWKKNNSQITIVGYAVLHPKTPSDKQKCFRRRVFYLKPHDFDWNGSPIEAVDPNTVEVGKLGE